MEDLLLPTGYISYTQYNLWKKNKERYIKQYFEGADKLDTPYLRFGKRIAEMIENGTIKQLLPELDVYEIKEHEIKVKVKDVPILSYLDSYNADDNLFYEFKTGKIAWTQAKVLKHEQLVFYAMALKWVIGNKPDFCHLVWIETKDNEEMGLSNNINITGKIQKFKRIFSDFEIERMENDIQKVALEISTEYKEWIKKLTL